MSNTSNAAALAQQLADALARQSESAMDETRVIELIQEHAPARKLEISIGGKPASATPEGAQHYKFPLLLTCLANGIHVLLAGEAGSGKTSAAQFAADILGLDFFAMSFSATTTKSDLQGYTDANGKYVTTNFRRAFESGGIFCADEFDAGNANSNASINQALANHTAGFPDGMTARHENFITVACANTFGKGASSRYVGRNKLDAATLDRFAVIQWDIDEALEASFIGVEQKGEEMDLEQGGVVSPRKWLQVCRAARTRAQEMGSEMIISPRAVKAGAQLCEAGVGRHHLEELFIYKGADEATREKIAPFLDMQ